MRPTRTSGEVQATHRGVGFDARSSTTGRLEILAVRVCNPGATAAMIVHPRPATANPLDTPA